MTNFYETVSAGVLDMKGKEIGFTYMISTVGKKPAAWVGESRLDTDSYTWNLINTKKKQPKGCPGNPHVFESDVDARAWAEAIARSEAAAAAQREDTMPLGTGGVKPTVMAKRLGARSLAHVSKKSGISANTLINWYSKRFQLFKIVCLGVANLTEEELYSE